MTIRSATPVHTSLEGGFLVAAPGKDGVAPRGVIYVCQHSPDGAMGFVLNKPKPEITFPQLLQQLDVVSADDVIDLPPQTADIQVLDAGFVETTRGFVLHSRDFDSEGQTQAVDGDVAYTSSMDILHAMARSAGPQRAVMALGYAGWGPGAIETEIRSGDWLFCPADPDLVFGSEDDPGKKYSRALELIGITDIRLLHKQASA